MPFFQVAKRSPSSAACCRSGVLLQAFIAWAAVCQIRVMSLTGDCAWPPKIGSWSGRGSSCRPDAALGRGGLDQNGSASGRMNMEFRSSTRRALLLAGTFGTLRSEEHTSELQSHLNLLCPLLLVK